jgi:hypothetical protein
LKIAQLRKNLLSLKGASKRNQHFAALFCHPVAEFVLDKNKIPTVQVNELNLLRLPAFDFEQVAFSIKPI